MQKTFCSSGDAIKLIYDKDNLLIVKKTIEVFELPHFNVIGYPCAKNWFSVSVGVLPRFRKTPSISLPRVLL